MQLERQFVPTTLHEALEEDEILSHPLSNKNDDILSPRQIESRFDDISYSKGI